MTTMKQTWPAHSRFTRSSEGKRFKRSFALKLSRNKLSSRLRPLLNTKPNRPLKKLNDKLKKPRPVKLLLRARLHPQKVKEAKTQVFLTWMLNS